MHKRIIKYFLFIIFLGGAIYFCWYGYNKINKELNIKGANNISLYDNNNEIVFQGNGTNKWVGLDQISSNVINATI